MAELLTTKEILVALENIIKKAEKFICIFTYNIKIDENYMSRLRNADKRGVKIIIVFGIEDTKPELIDWLQGLSNCTVYFKEYLHAKFFYNEKELLLGSMNLSEASARNNYELGALFKFDENPEMFKKVKSEAKEIIEDAEEWGKRKKVGRISVSKTEKKHNKTYRFVKVDSSPTESKFKGKCIRCGDKIKFDQEKPLCRNCYTDWAEWENEDYIETFCHNCGLKKDDITFAKPECFPCYRNTKVLN